jgi:hypothetical protein
MCYRALWRAFQRGELFPVEEPGSVEASASTMAGSHDLRVVALSEQIETLSAIVALMQEHKTALLAEGSAMAVVAANQQELMTRTVLISSQLDYMVTLLEWLVGRQETTETRVAKIDERTAHLKSQHAHYVREIVDRIVRRLIGAVRGDRSPTRRSMRKSLVASNDISAWRSTIRSQTTVLRKSKPGCKRSGIGYEAVHCQNREASSRGEREEASRSKSTAEYLSSLLCVDEYCPSS